MENKEYDNAYKEEVKKRKEEKKQCQLYNISCEYGICDECKFYE